MSRAVVYFFLTLFSLAASRAFSDGSRTNPAAELIQLSSNKTTYAVNEIATFQVKFLTQPQNPLKEFYVRSTLAGVAMDIDRVSENLGYTVAKLSEVKTYVWQVKVYLQDKDVVADLYESIDNWYNENAELDKRIVRTIEVAKINELKNLKARNLDLIQGAKASINENRTLVGSAVNLSVTVQ